MNSKFLIWIAIGVGIVLMYAAYKGKNPKDIIASVLSKPATA